jgi:LmbE family N-acetylglucosaminyl deacetylase
MSIHAHPDDQEFTVAGTLAKWARAGSEITSVCITSGDSGSNQKTDPSITKQELVKIREEEQRNAARVLGLKETVFLRYADGVRRYWCGYMRGSFQHKA